MWRHSPSALLRYSITTALSLVRYCQTLEHLVLSVC